MSHLFFFRKSGEISADLKEELINSSLVIKGNIPDWLSGTLIRNGPISVTISDQTNARWIDGLAMLHAFSFNEGKVSYTNKFLRTNAYKQFFKKGFLHYDEFVKDPCRSLFKHSLTWLVPNSQAEPHKVNGDIANFTNVVNLADQYVALTEIPLPVRIDPKTLDTLAVLEYQDKLPHEKCWESVHPHHDLKAQQTLNYLIQYGQTSYYTLYLLADGSFQREIIAQIPVQEPAYMHSFAVTENYVIFTEFPFVVKPLDLLTKGEAFAKSFSWKPERGTQFIVIDRQNGQVIGKYTTDPFFAFHHANAFEADGNIYLDIVTYDDARVVTERLDSEGEKRPLEEGTQFSSRLDRFVLSLKTKALSSHTLLKKPVEFPRINEGFDGKSYQYVYMTDARDPISDSDVGSIYKVNVETRDTLQWSEEGCYPGEPIFVADPHSRGEDKGVILAVVLDLSHHISFLLVLDAKTFQEIGRAKITHVIPSGLHGQYFQIN